MRTILLLAVFTGILGGCGTSPETMKNRLDEIAKADLSDILKEVPETAKSVKLAKPHFVVDEYQEFHGDTSRVYQARAVLVFFYLDPGINLCQVRKYRFKRSMGTWDRYEVKLMHFPKKYLGTAVD